MRAKRIMANLRVPDVDAAKSFYTDYLGLIRGVQHGLGCPLHLSRHRCERPTRPLDTRSGDQIGTCWPIQPDRRRVTLAGEVV